MRKPAITRDGRSYRFQITANEHRHPRCFAVMHGGNQRVAAVSVLDAAEAWFSLMAQSADAGAATDGVRGTMLRMVGSGGAVKGTPPSGAEIAMVRDNAEADAAVDSIMASLSGGN